MKQEKLELLSKTAKSRHNRARGSVPAPVMALLIAIHDKTYWPHRAALNRHIADARNRKLVHPTMIALTAEGEKRLHRYLYDTETKPRKQIRPVTVYIECSPPLLSYPTL